MREIPAYYLPGRQAGRRNDRYMYFGDGTYAIDWIFWPKEDYSDGNAALYNSREKRDKQKTTEPPAAKIDQTEELKETNHPITASARSWLEAAPAESIRNEYPRGMIS